MQISNRKNIIFLFRLLQFFKIKDVAVCPGSRNAPIIRSLAANVSYTLHSFYSEKIAAFACIGMQRATQNPVAITCTSGSALLNMAPAICEAFYSHIPLLILSADRPKYLINKGDNQTIKQENIFGNYCRYYAEVAENIEENDYLEIVENIKKNLPLGPVHLNFPFEEPLYEMEEILELMPISITENEMPKPVAFDYSILKDKKIWIYTTENSLSSSELKIIEEGVLSQKWAWLGEVLSNSPSPYMLYKADFWIKSLPKSEWPEVLITIGKQMISKRMRFFFKSISVFHIHIAPEYLDWDLGSPYFCFPFSKAFFNELLEKKASLDYTHLFKLDDLANTYAAQLATKYTNSCLSVCYFVARNLENGTAIFWGNSTSIRYANWIHSFESAHILHFGNRGVSGIEGVLSTAIGYAKLKPFIPVVCILGDVSLAYEIDAFSLAALFPNLKIIMLNNGGGRIFENIYPHLDSKEKELFLTPPSFIHFSKIAEAQGMKWINIKLERNFQFEWFDLLHSDCQFIEVQTEFFPQLWQQMLDNFSKYTKDKPSII